MKIAKNLLLLATTLLLFQCGTSMTVLKPVQRSKIISVDSKTKNQLYIRANTWMVETFNNAKSVIQFSDKESGIVIGKYLMKSIITSTTTRNDVYAIIKIQAKDGSTKITITPDSYINSYNSFAGGQSYPIVKLYQDINKLFQNFSDNIVNTENSNW